MLLADLLTINDVENSALPVLPSATRDYVSSGADNEISVRENVRAFDDFYILPRTLVNVSEINTSVTILNQTFSSPIGFAPSAFHKLYHEDGELATAVRIKF